MTTQPLRRGRKYEGNLDWCKQADTFIDRFGSILRHVNVKPAVRRSDFHGCRPIVTCTTSRLYGHVVQFLDECIGDLSLIWAQTHCQLSRSPTTHTEAKMCLRGTTVYCPISGEAERECWSSFFG